MDIWVEVKANIASDAFTDRPASDSPKDNTIEKNTVEGKVTRGQLLSYAAAVLSSDNNQIRLIIHEEYQHPSMFGKVSFPSQGGGDTIRAYIKDSILRRDHEDDDEMASDDEYYDGGDENEEMNEIEFDDSIESEG